MSSPQHFECLEEEEITGHSNTPHFVTRYKSFGGGRNYTVLNGTQTLKTVPSPLISLEEK